MPVLNQEILINPELSYACNGWHKSKKSDKDQEWIQPSTSPVTQDTTLESDKKII